jgi:hypothetical protein
MIYLVARDSIKNGGDLANLIAQVVDLSQRSTMQNNIQQDKLFHPKSKRLSPNCRVASGVNRL